MIRRILFIIHLVCCLAFHFLHIPLSLAASCAKVKVISGTTCEDLVIKFFLSECGDAGGKATLTCGADGKNIATFKGRNAVYSARFKESESWGTKTWIVDDEVEFTELPPAEHPKAKRKERARTSEIAQEKKEPSPATGELPPLAPPAPQSPTPASSDITFTGGFDTYFATNFNLMGASSPNTTLNGASSNGYLPPPHNNFRTTDLYDNAFAVNFVEVTLQKKTKEVTYKIDFDFGILADWLAGPSISALTPPTQTETIFKNIGQAIVSWTPSATPRLTLNVGKIDTYIGLEVPKTKDNWNYSRPFLFQLGVPFWHTGFNAQYALVPGKMTFGFHLYNPTWNSILAYNAGKTFGVQFGLTPWDNVAVNFNGMVSTLNPGDSANKTYLFNHNVLWTISPTVSFAYDLVMVSWANATLTGVNSTWTAFEVLSKITLSSKFYISPRVEIFSDPQGLATGLYYSGITPIPNTTLTEVTLTAGLTLADGLETRLEGRLDSASSALFATSGNAAKTQPTALIGFLYNF